MLDQPGLVADQWREEGPWLLLGLIPLAALAFRRGWWLPVFALALVLPPVPGSAFDWDALWRRPDQQAASYLAAGDDAAAAQRFADPAWRAAARYRSGDYVGALADLTGLTGPEADYNRGNALARLGRLEESIGAYEQAIAQAPDHVDARANLDQVKRLRDQQDQAQPPPQGQQDGQREENGTAGKEGQDGQQGQGEPNTANGQKSDTDPGAQGEGKQADSGQAAGHSSGDTEQAGTKGAAGTGAAARGDEPGPDQAGAPGGTADRSGDSAPPKAGDLGPEAPGGEPPLSLPGASGPHSDQQGRSSAVTATQAANGAAQPEAAGGQRGLAADLSPQEREQQQAMEAQLRRVPDDPAGLLRQRFLLQQLRREGRLP